MKTLLILMFAVMLAGCEREEAVEKLPMKPDYAPAIAEAETRYQEAIATEKALRAALSDFNLVDAEVEVMDGRLTPNPKTYADVAQLEQFVEAMKRRTAAMEVMSEALADYAPYCLGLEGSEVLVAEVGRASSAMMESSAYWTLKRKILSGGTVTAEEMREYQLSVVKKETARLKAESALLAQ